MTNRGGIRERLRAYNEYWARPPSRWQQVAAVFLTPFPSVALWDKRGAAVAIVALLFYGWILVIGAFRYRQMVAWQRQHRTLHSLLTVPSIFLLLAVVTNLALALCIAIAAAFGAVFVPFTFMLRRRFGTSALTAAS